MKTTSIKDIVKFMVLIEYVYYEINIFLVSINCSCSANCSFRQIRTITLNPLFASHTACVAGPVPRHRIFYYIIIYKVNTLNEQMEQKCKYVLVGYAVADQDFCNISEFSSVSWMQRHNADRVSSFNFFYLLRKSLFEAPEIIFHLLAYSFHILFVVFLQRSYFHLFCCFDLFKS
jgi:hypothetical protein